MFYFVVIFSTIFVATNASPYLYHGRTRPLTAMERDAERCDTLYDQRPRDYEERMFNAYLHKSFDDDNNDETSDEMNPGVPYREALAASAKREHLKTMMRDYDRIDPRSKRINKLRGSSGRPSSRRSLGDEDTARFMRIRPTTLVGRTDFDLQSSIDRDHRYNNRITSNNVNKNVNKNINRNYNENINENVNEISAASKNSPSLRLRSDSPPIYTQYRINEYDEIEIDDRDDDSKTYADDVDDETTTNNEDTRDVESDKIVADDDASRDENHVDVDDVIDVNDHDDIVKVKMVHKSKNHESSGRTKDTKKVSSKKTREESHNEEPQNGSRQEDSVESQRNDATKKIIETTTTKHRTKLDDASDEEDVKVEETTTKKEVTDSSESTKIKVESEDSPKRTNEKLSAEEVNEDADTKSSLKSEVTESTDKSKKNTEVNEESTDSRDNEDRKHERSKKHRTEKSDVRVKDKRGSSTTNQRKAKSGNKAIKLQLVDDSAPIDVLQQMTEDLARPKKHEDAKPKKKTQGRKLKKRKNVDEASLEMRILKHKTDSESDVRSKSKSDVISHTKIDSLTKHKITVDNRPKTSGTIDSQTYRRKNSNKNVNKNKLRDSEVEKNSNNDVDNDDTNDRVRKITSNGKQAKRGINDDAMVIPTDRDANGNDNKHGNGNDNGNANENKNTNANNNVVGDDPLPDLS